MAAIQQLLDRRPDPGRRPMSGHASPVGPGIKPALDRRPRGRPRTKDLAALETRLLRVARDLFRERGYGATSMNAIAAAAWVSKTTLWSRYSSKAALFHAVVSERSERWMAGVDRPAAIRADTLEQAMFAYGEIVLDASLNLELPRLSSAIIGEVERIPEVREAVAAKHRLGVAAIAAHIEYFAKRDGVACRDAGAAANYFLNALTGWSYRCVLTGCLPTREEQACWLRMTVAIFVGGRSRW